MRATHRIRRLEKAAAPGPRVVHLYIFWGDEDELEDVIDGELMTEARFYEKYPDAKKIDYPHDEETRRGKNE